MGLASTAIDRLLGGTGEAERIQRPLTDIEQGVLSFIVLKVLSHFHDGFESGRELALFLDRFRLHARRARAHVRRTRDVSSSLAAHSRSATRSATCASSCPRRSSTERFGKPVPRRTRPRLEHAYMLKALDSLGDIAVIGRVEAATLDLSRDDLAGLEVLAISSFSRIMNFQSRPRVSVARLRQFGGGRNGGVRGRILEGDPQRLEIAEIVLQAGAHGGANV